MRQVPRFTCHLSYDPDNSYEGCIIWSKSCYGEMWLCDMYTLLWCCTSLYFLSAKILNYTQKKTNCDFDPFSDEDEGETDSDEEEEMEAAGKTLLSMCTNLSWPNKWNTRCTLKVSLNFNWKAVQYYIITGNIKTRPQSKNG